MRANRRYSWRFATCRQVAVSTVNPRDSRGVSSGGVLGDAFGAGVAQSAVIFDGHTLIAPKEIASERGAIGGPAVA